MPEPTFASSQDTAAARRLVTASERKRRVTSFACLTDASPALPMRPDELACFAGVRGGGCTVWAVALDKRDVRRVRPSESFGYFCVTNQP
jgi:hypothetical protein